MANEDLTLDRISTVRFRPTKDADEFLSFLRNTLITGERYRVARLAISRSLVEPTPPLPIVKGQEMASAIDGATLFGEDKPIWACLVTQAAGVPISSAEDFKRHVEAHWHRGAELLKGEFASVKENETEFALHIANLAGPAGRRQDVNSSVASAGSAMRLTARFGEVGIEIRSNSTIDITLNSQGVSPHIALMGKTRSGKTRTGLAIAERIASDATLPILLIDPKGDFVRDGKLVAQPEWGGATLEKRFPGIQPIDVPETPIPLDFLSLPRNSTPTQKAEAAISFRDSFRSTVRNKGDVAMDSLRESVERILQGSPQRVSLEQIRDEISRANAGEGRKRDSVEAKLNELTSLRLFEPTLSPNDFFKKRWVIGLNRASPESKRLVMFLILDALATHLLSMTASATDSLGHRAARHLLIIDEAVEILRYKHHALSKLVRQSASKGGIVMLLSQSPEDFDQEEDDFLQQMGTVGVFASSARSVHGVSAAFGRKMRPDEFGDRELSRGVALVKLPGRDPQKIIAWR